MTAKPTSGDRLPAVGNGIVTLYVADMDRAVHFYTESLGFSLTARYGNHFALIAAPGLSIGLHPATSVSTAGDSGSVQIGFEARGPLSEAREELSRRGVTFPSPSRDDDESRGPRIAHFSDPDGHALYLVELRDDGPKPN